jgi:uncharacterized protein YdaU (DUF1376 family)
MRLSGVITIPFHIGDFLSGTMHMDTLEKGAYIMLLLSHYQSGEQGLPDDDKKLSRICGVTLKVWQRIRPTLEEKFIIENDFWRSSKCIEVLRKVHDKSSNQRAKALKRHNSDDATAMPRQCQPKPKPKPLILSKDNIVKPHDVSNQVWDDFLRHRKNVKAKLTQTALDGIIRESEKAGWSLENALIEICHRGWKGFKAEWVKEKGKKEDAMFNAWKNA